jgi:hypothetical protein
MRMQPVLVFLTVAALFNLEALAIAQETPEGWKLVWQDELTASATTG